MDLPAPATDVVLSFLSERASSTLVSYTAQTYVGSYRLLNLLRTGKTCQVWEVMDDLQRRRLAIKRLLAEYRGNREEVAYLRHEHDVGCKLEHPHVIRIYEFGREQDDVYLAMELFAALNLKQILLQDSTRLQVHLPTFVEQAAEGLNYLHGQGWIHRDVKPDNFLMNRNGDVRLIDFALAERRRGALSRLFSGRGKIQGTRSYMSPEQIRCKRVDERSDLYSFGCTLHELFTGKPPFTGSTTNELLNKHLKNPPPSILASNRNVTEEFADLVRCTLAKKPDSRPDSMEEFLREFRAIKVYKSPPKASSN